MINLLAKFRGKVIKTAWKNKEIDKSKIKDLDKSVALGVLLWAVGAVAEADGKLLPKESEEIKEIIRSYVKISEEDFPIVLTTIRLAGIEKIDFYKFARESNKYLSHDAKISIIENLLRVACADMELDEREFAIINKLANLFHLKLKEFNDIKSCVKEEIGLGK